MLTQNKVIEPKVTETDLELELVMQMAGELTDSCWKKQ